MKTVYGPISSWRLGRSLGIDPICRKLKVCSFDCIYCQLGRTKKKISKRRIFVPTERIKKDINEVLPKTEARTDIITFAGTSEPTLAKNIGEIIDYLKGITDLPLAILTNSSLLFDEKVREDLYKLDKVVAKLDAPNQEILEKINGPTKKITFEKILEGIKEFRKNYQGRFALQIMFVKKNKEFAKNIAEIAKRISPDEIEINTPLRPPKAGPLNREEIQEIKKKFSELKNVLTVYEAKKPKVSPVDLEEVYERKRREP